MRNAPLSPQCNCSIVMIFWFGEWQNDVKMNDLNGRGAEWDARKELDDEDVDHCPEISGTINFFLASALYCAVVVAVIFFKVRHLA